ncbi:metallophosphoesterase [uncultured Meiothermus sp.]|jgi:predicted phosphodiesterase|uniref:metallophosphoesterase family protein n=1 Tax=uncultured Meiothermus sp. TaxID=157471 RepID=UPI0026032303|nr:metallophosphoesterase [uncultured Meiothermus sp.]
MRIAVLSDIHGNLPALEAVLADLGQVRAHLVVVNGDLVNRGPSSREVVECLLDLKSSRQGHALAPEGFWFTLGNHDDLVARWARRDPALAELYNDPLFEPTAWSVAQLPQAHLDWVGSLPFQVAIEEFPRRVFGLEQAEGIGERVLVRATHGSPRHYREGYDEHQTPGILTEISEDYPARLLVGSHTHRTYMYPLGEALVLNSGAVGAPFNGDVRAQYAVVEIGENHLQVDFRQIPYNLQAALQTYYDSGLMEEGGLGAEIYYQETRTARSLLMNFWAWSKGQNLPRDWDSWRMYQAAHPERFSSPK